MSSVRSLLQPLATTFLALRKVLRASHKNIQPDLGSNIALLFLWVFIFGLFSHDYSTNIVINLWQSLLYLINAGDGFLYCVCCLSPLIAWRPTAQSRLRLFFFLPLLYNIMHYQYFIRDYYNFWGFWLSLIISFYAALNIARFYYRPAPKNLSPFLLKIKKLDKFINRYFYQPINQACRLVRQKIKGEN